jgi:hypothetical protein
MPRCPKGTRKNKKTGQCEPVSKGPSSSPIPSEIPASDIPSPIPASAPKSAPQKAKKCPKGTRKNKKTGECEETGPKSPYVDPAVKAEWKRLITRIHEGTLKEKDLDGIQIKNENFKSIDGKNITLQNVNLFMSTLKDVTFTDANLIGTIFEKAKLENVEFKSCKMSFIFAGATLKNVKFVDSGLEMVVDFTDAKFKNVVFDGIMAGVKRAIEEELDEEQKKEVQFINVIEEEQSAYSVDSSDSTGSIWKPGDKSNETGCPSKGFQPSKDCKTYRKQSLVFHPDKNINCRDAAEKKMKKLNDYCM